LQKKELFYVYIFFLLIYLLACSGHIGGDGFYVFLSAKSLIEDGDINLINLKENFGVAELESNYNKAYESMQKLKEDGVDEYFTFYGLGPVILEVPFYFAGHIIGKIAGEGFYDYATLFFVSLANCFVTALSCLYVFLFCMKLAGDRKKSFLIALIFGFGTMVYAYAVKSGASEPLQGLAVLGAAYHAFTYIESQSRKELIFFGLFAGLALLTKFYSLMLIGILLTYIFVTGRKNKKFYSDVLYFISSFFMCVLIFFIYNYSRYGSILETGYTTSSGADIFDTAGWEILDYSMLNTISRAFGFLFSSGKGLLFFAPVIFLSWNGFKRMFQKRRNEAFLFIALFLVFFIFFSILTSWYGDWSWGPRYLYPVLPFLILPVCINNSSGNYIRKLKIFFIVGVLVQVPSVVMSYSDFIRFTDENRIHSYRHFNPQFSPILGGYLQFFSGIKRVITGESLSYPVTYRYNKGEGIEFMPSFGFTRYDKINMAPYDRFDLWFTNAWALSGKRSILVKFFVIIVLITGILLTYIVWKRLKLILY